MEPGDGVPKKTKFCDSVEIKRFPEKVNQTEGTMWSCAKCTLKNQPKNQICQACNYPNHVPRKSIGSRLFPRSSSSSRVSSLAVVNASKATVSSGSTSNLRQEEKTNATVTTTTDDQCEKEKFVPVSLTSEDADIIRQIEESEAAEQYQRIVDYCKLNNQSFVDDSFPPCEKSIGKFGQTALDRAQPDVHDDPNFLRDVQPVVWRRPFHILDSSVVQWSVYSSRPKSTDIMQGFLGNCWFLSALALLAERSDLLEHVVITRRVNLEGAYQIRLCVDGKWKIIIVDDYLPCNRHGRIVFSHSKNRQLWVPLIEKALAKLHGSYTSLSTGRTVEGLSTLTGAPSVTLSLEQDETHPDQPADLNLIWATLVSAKEAGFIMGTSCGAGSRPVDDELYKRLGLHQRHAYSLLDLQDLSGIRLVRLRNPWGHGEWTGDWSNGSDLWLDRAFGASSMAPGRQNGLDQSGLFWMPFEEFCKYFDSVDICKLRPGRKEVRIEVPLPTNCTPNNVYCVYLTVEETTEIDLALYQSGLRNETHRNSYGILDLSIFIFESDVYGKMGALMAASERCMRAFVVLNTILEKGTYMVLCTSFVHWNLANLRRVPRAILTAHSLNSLTAQLTQAVNCPNILADSLQRYLMRHGEPYTELEDVMIYYSSKKWSGMAIMVENRNRQAFLVVKCNCSLSENVVSTRSTLTTADVVPPAYRQVVILLTQAEPSARYYIKHSLSYVHSREPYLGPAHAPNGLTSPYVAHSPPLDVNVRALHECRPIF